MNPHSRAKRVGGVSIGHIHLKAALPPRVMTQRGTGLNETTGGVAIGGNG